MMNSRRRMGREYGDAKRILVTCGAGFLGSHLCERLLNDGHEVLAADNFFTGEPVTSLDEGLEKTIADFRELIGAPQNSYERKNIWLNE
jgi:nucleoside-diphosphate-sugar epimerase